MNPHVHPRLPPPTSPRRAGWLLLVTLALLLPNSARGGDHYSTLGLSRGASTEEVRKAYKSLARKWHPDKCKEDTKDECKDRFIAVQEAHEVLHDPKTREEYDDGGGNSGDGHGQGQQGQPTHYRYQFVYRNGQYYRVRVPVYQNPHRRQSGTQLELGGLVGLMFMFIMAMGLLMKNMAENEDGDAGEGSGGGGADGNGSGRGGGGGRAGGPPGYDDGSEENHGGRGAESKAYEPGRCHGLARRRAPSIHALSARVLGACKGRHLALMVADSSNVTNIMGAPWVAFETAATKFRTDPVIFAWADMNDEVKGTVVRVRVGCSKGSVQLKGIFARAGVNDEVVFVGWGEGQESTRALSACTLVCQYSSAGTCRQ